MLIFYAILQNKIKIFIAFVVFITSECILKSGSKIFNEGSSCSRAFHFRRVKKPPPAMITKTIDR